MLREKEKAHGPVCADGVAHLVKTNGFISCRNAAKGELTVTPISGLALDSHG